MTIQPHAYVPRKHSAVRQARRRRGARGLFAQLTRKQQQAVLAYDGPVGFGRSDLPAAKRPVSK